MKQFIIALIIFFICQPLVLAKKHETIIAYMHNVCWVDNGVKAIFFSDGSTYIFHPEKVSAAGNVHFHPLHTKINKQQMTELVDAFESNHFNDIPKELYIQACDGNDLTVYFANFDTYHKVHDYMVFNSALDHISQYIEKLVPALMTGTTEISNDQVLTDLRFRLKNLSTNSPLHDCLSNFLSSYAGLLIAHGQMNHDQVKDLLLKGVN